MCINFYFFLRSLSSSNPFREAFCILHDEHVDKSTFGDTEMISLGSPSNRKVHIDFESILNSLLVSLPSESAAILLYSLLQTHPTFLEVIMSNRSTFPAGSDVTSRIRSLMGAILRGLYDVENAHSVDHLYVLVVCVLILVQDASVSPYIVSIKIDAPWYRERLLQSVSLCDLVILCVIRTIMHALFRLRDQYLVYNCFAVLLNLTSVLSEIHSYAAERLVKVTCRLCKRIIKIKEAEEKLISKAGVHASLSTENPVKQSITLPIEALEETLRVFFKAIGTIIANLQNMLFVSCTSSFLIYTKSFYIRNGT